MASSRTPALPADLSLRLTAKVAQAVQAGAAFVVSGSRERASGLTDASRVASASAENAGDPASPASPVVAVALSGGRDSVALLHAARALTGSGAMPGAASMRVVGLHVHHGLQAMADDWERFCRAYCARLGVDFHAMRTTVSPTHGEGIEAAARRARYGALQAMCADAGADLLLFAHHLDDQVETVLLRLFRGAGVHGLAGMPAMRRLDGGNAGHAATAGPAGARRPTLLLRPWLDVPRSDIEDYCAVHRLDWIDDPSNGDGRFARNALRARMPALLQSFPQLRGSVAQAAGHLADAAALIDAQARGALAGLLRPGRDAATRAELDLDGLRGMPATLGDAVLRLWLRDLGVRAPSAARLAAMRDQLIVRDGGEPAVAHDGLVLRRFRTRLLACASRAPEPPARLALPQWRGEAVVPVPAWHGALHFVRDDTGGIPETVLAGPLTLVPRRGGERIVLRPGGPARALKQAYQEAGVPAWRRPWLPLLWAGERLVLAGGLGMHRRWADEPSGPRWAVAWQDWPESGGAGEPGPDGGETSSML